MTPTVASGSPASRTLRAAQSLYEDKKALTYPRTSSRYLPSDLIPQLKPTAETLTVDHRVRPSPGTCSAWSSCRCGRVVDDAKIGDHHAIIPTVAAHAVEKYRPDEQTDLRPGSAALPGGVPPAGPLRPHDRRHGGRRRDVPHAGAQSPSRSAGAASTAPWRTSRDQHQDDEEERGELPPLERGQPVRCVRAESGQRTTKPPPRFNEATLLSAMETAGKLVDDEALREALKESRARARPPTRAETIETLIRREYVERHGKDLTPTPKGMQVITLLGTTR